MPNPPILVIIPSYNHGKFIGDRVRSVLEQTYSSLDVHLIDDGSTDETMEMLSAFSDSRLKISQREENSGSPFTAWIDACRLIEMIGYDYIWIAESDDMAGPDFVEKAVSALSEFSEAALYYCHSWFINDTNMIIGHSINYLNRYFDSINWNKSWKMSGDEFIRTCLIKGMAIPNMSSAVMRADAFLRAFRPEFQRYKLAADWAFASEIARHGDIIFDAWDGNFFRHHARTSRTETQIARLVFEHIGATRTAFLSGAVEKAAYRNQMKIFKGMYRNEGVRLPDFIKAGWTVSPSHLMSALWHLYTV